MSDDLVEWLRAQLDEDEREASDPNWWKRPHGSGCAIGADHAPECDCDYAGRVLREVEAKRRRLERHTPLSGGACDYCHEYGGEHVAWPCPDIRDDAAVFADCPGYDENWRP